MPHHYIPVQIKANIALTNVKERERERRRRREREREREREKERRERKSGEMGEGRVEECLGKEWFGKCSLSLCS